MVDVIVGVVMVGILFERFGAPVIVSDGSCRQGKAAGISGIESCFAGRRSYNERRDRLREPGGNGRLRVYRGGGRHSLERILGIRSVDVAHFHGRSEPLFMRRNRR